jgi:hypothetical protein
MHNLEPHLLEILISFWKAILAILGVIFVGGFLFIISMWLHRDEPTAEKQELLEEQG